jgi:hypothetical protein
MKQFIVLSLLAVWILGCEEREEKANVDKKLDYYVESFDVPGLGFVPQAKVDYDYDLSGKLVKYTVYSYDPNRKALVEQRYCEFSYVNGRVDEIKGSLATTNEVSEVYRYQYLPDARVSKIIEDNRLAQVTSEADFTYAGDTIRVSFSYSNGASFEYRFLYTNKNISWDVTTQGSGLCSSGQYTYDQSKNPFNSLGYVDYRLFNLSTNNKLTENVDYVGCSFPAIKPVSYSYVYDNHGYPIESITTYKSTGPIAKSQKKYFYREQ